MREFIELCVVLGTAAAVVVFVGYLVVFVLPTALILGYLLLQG